MDVCKLLDKNGNPSRLKKTANSPLLAAILEQYPHEDENTAIYLAKHDLKQAPTCQKCGKPLKIRNFKLGFVSKWCSTECRNTDEKFIAFMKSQLQNYDREKALKKRKETNKKKYGVEHQLQRKEIIERVSKVNNLNRDSIIEKNRQTCLERYGVPCSLQIPEIKEKLANLKESYPQKRVREYIESLGFKCKTDRSVISPLEIDILIEEKKIGFEINGVFWHSSFDSESDAVMKKRHLTKTFECSSKGYRLVHFTDIEILKKEPIVFSMIQSILGKTSERVFARKCEVVQLESRTARDFLEKTHIQGAAPCSIYLGLFNSNELVSVMGFSKSRFDKNYDWELVRFSSKLNTTVVGGFSKLLKYFRSVYKGSIVSYADFSRSNGEVYEKCGFTRQGISNPSYRWVSINQGEIFNRHLFMRRSLPRILGKNFDPALSEAQNCWNMGFRKIWDCGQIKFILQ